MSILLLVGVMVVVGIVLKRTWKDIEPRSTPTEVLTEPIVEAPIADAAPPVYVDSQITDAVTVKKPRKSRAPKITDAS